MRIVLDASTTCSWLFHDEADDRAAQALASLRQGAEALVPLLWWFEVRNVALSGIRRRRTTQTEVEQFFTDLEDITISLAGLAPNADIFALAHRHRLSFYEACYLELAKRERIALATVDRGLADAARAENVPLLGAA